MNIKMKKALAGGVPPGTFAYSCQQVIEIDDERGAAWIKGGNAVAAEDHEKATAKHPEESVSGNESVDREAEILDAVRLIVGEDDKSKLIASGAPSVEALEDLLGYDISSTERDTAYGQVQ